MTDVPLPSDAQLVVRNWASHLTAETRKVSWIADWYVMPDEVSSLCRSLLSKQGSLHALIGYQGVGKTSALLAIQRELRKPQLTDQDHRPLSSRPVYFFKWERLEKLVPRLLRQENHLGKDLRRAFLSSLEETIRQEEDLNSITSTGTDKRSKEISILRKLLKSYEVAEIERRLGKSVVERLRYETFLRTIEEAQVILIDLPDYSKTDMRKLSSDLETIYRIWNEFSGRLFTDSPNIVISFQKEMFRDHYFLGKMSRIDLRPLKSEKLVEAYEKCFPRTEVFTSDVLLLLARMSRGVFRRFLRYITLVLDHQERANTSFPITPDQVREAIPPQLLAEDMDQQLTEIFPRQPELRTQAVKLLLCLEEHGPTSQTKITEELSIPNYTVSRLLGKLEDHRYIRREKEGVENIVSIQTP